MITLITEGQSVLKIAKSLTVSPSAVAKTIKHYDETCSHEDRPWEGRPCATPGAEDKFIQVSSLRKHKLTAQSSSSKHTDCVNQAFIFK